MSKIALALFLASPAALATTWTVDDSGGADFTTISAAIAAAVDGDVIVVRPGSYSAFDVVGKSLVVRAESGGSVEIFGLSRVRSLASTQSVELASLSFSGPADPVSESFSAELNAGTVTIWNCLFKGSNGISTVGYASGRTAALFTDTARAIVLGSTFDGGLAHSGNAAGWGGHGLRVQNGNLLILDSLVRGGHGGTNTFFETDGGHGGHALVADAAGVRAARTSFFGGNGGHAGASGFPGGCYSAGRGGDCIHFLSTGTSTFAANGVAYIPGLRGSFSCGDQPASTGSHIFGGTASPLVATPYCFGLDATCPCANRGFGEAGCETSFATGGGQLVMSGTPSVVGDTLTLDALGLPPAGTAIVFQGTSSVGALGAGAVFGDGLRCAGGAVLRLGSKTVSLGVASFGAGAGDPPLSSTGAIPPTGGVRFYQVWFRNAAAYCTSSTFNLTHGLEIVWSS